MEKIVKKRDFKVGDSVYVVDYWDTDKGCAAFEAHAEIVQVNKESESFLAVLYGDTYRTYSFKDYGRLIFDTKQQAISAANAVPKPTSIVYQIIGNRLYKKTVLNIYDSRINGVTDLVMYLNVGKEVSIKEIGITIFTNEQQARKSVKK